VTLLALAAPRLGAEPQRRDRDGRETQTERITKTLAIGADGELDVSNIAGDITITRGGGSSATIEVIKTARAGSADEARAMLGLVTVDIAERGTRAEVRTRYPDDRRINNRQNVNVDVAYNIAAPANARVLAKSISGNISVRDISGALSVDTVSGTVQLANVGRVANAKSISGNVELSDTRVEGALEASTVSGEVKMRKVSGRSLSMSTVSGSVQLQDIECERVNAQSISGQVTYTGDLVSNGRYDFTSHSGGIRIAIGTATGFQVEASSFSGSISSDLPLTGGQSFGRRQHSLRGTYGNGSAVLNLTAFSGSISITKR
jgi:DUF4097 and DUF4098 domain-containing protein YvlB